MLDLLFIVNLLSQFTTNIHWEAIKHTIAYIKDIIDYEITYTYIHGVSF